MKGYDVLTVFDTCVDLVVELGDTSIEFDQKEKLVQSADISLGGSNCIFACQCAKLGLKTAGVGIVGTDSFGDTVKKELASGGVSLEYVKTDSSVKTAVGISLNRGGDRSILTYDASIVAVRADMVTDEMLKNARHLHLGSYYLLGGVREEAAELLRRAQELGLSTSLDTNWDPDERWTLPPQLLKHVDIFFPNESELRLLSGKSDLDEAAACFSVPLIAVKMGGDGARVYRQGTVTAAKTPRAEVVDTVGAGDSFDGGFLYGWLHGLPVESCLSIGLYCGTRNVEKRGGVAGQACLQQLEEAALAAQE